MSRKDMSSETTPEASINGLSRQLISIHVRTAWHLPKACLDAESVNLLTEVVELFDEIPVAERKAAGIEVAVVAPLDDPVCHTVDDVRRIGLDNDLVDGARILVSTIGEDVPELAESMDGGGQLGALTGWTNSVVQLERLVVHVVATPVDATSCDSVCPTVVATRTVGGDDYCATIAVLVEQAVAGMAHLDCGCEWMRRCLDLGVGLGF